MILLTILFVLFIALFAVICILAFNMYEKQKKVKMYIYSACLIIIFVVVAINLYSDNVEEQVISSTDILPINDILDVNIANDIYVVSRGNYYYYYHDGINSTAMYGSVLKKNAYICYIDNRSVHVDSVYRVTTRTFITNEQLRIEEKLLVKLCIPENSIIEECDIYNLI